MSTAAASTGGAPQSTGGAGSTGGGGSTGAIIGWGDDWRTRMAAGSTDPEKELTQLQRYESPEQVWRKAREFEKKLSAGELKSQLPKGASPEEVARWREQNGLPAKPEDYKLNMPQGKEPPPDDDAFLAAFRKSAHEANYSQAQFDHAVRSFYSEIDRQMDAMNEAEKKLEEQTEDKLRQEWGGDYRTNKALAEALLARAPAGFRDRFMNGYLADRTPIRASPEAWKWLVQMEREINPMGTVVPGAGADASKSVEKEKQELIRKSKAAKGSEDYKDYWERGGDARYRQLLEAEQRMKAKAGAAA